MRIGLLPGEQKIDSWTILYERSRTGKPGYSAKGILEGLVFIKRGSEGFPEISKDSFNYGAMGIDNCTTAIQSK